MSKNIGKSLLKFLKDSPISYHASNKIKQILEENNFQKLKEEDNWKLKKGNKYYIERNNSAVIAFTIGEKNITEDGFNLIGAHTDSPMLKLKNEAVIKKHNYIKIGTEVYGGPILNTWMDKDLSIAGRVSIIEEGEVKSKLIDFKDPLAIIPNLAIHMNRKVNKGFEINKQKHLPAIISTMEDKDKNDKNSKDKDEKNLLKKLISEKLDIDYDNISEFDLFLYDYNEPNITGLNKEFISSNGLDDLAMCHAILEALTAKNDFKGFNIGIFYDNEEIGSRTYQGANSNFLRDILERIVISNGGNRQDYFRALSNSFLISADQAHALHPNFIKKHDKNYQPIINQGPVIKLNANFRYATTSETASIFKKLCNEVGVKYQKLANRSDMRSGSTIGPMSSSLLNVKTVDIGNPIWAMHSIRETGGIKDQEDIIKVFKHFFK